MISLKEGLQLSDGGIVCLVGAGGKTTLMFRLAGELSAGGDSVLTTTTTRIRMPTRAQSPEVIISREPQAVWDRAGRSREKNFHFTAVSEKLALQEKLKGYDPEVIDDFRERELFRWILVEADGAAGRSLKAPAGHEPVIPSCTRRVIGIVGLDVVGKPLDEESVFRSALFARLTGLALGQTVSAAAVAAALAHADGIFKGSPAAADRYLFFNKAESAGRIQAGREVAEIIKKSPPGRLRRILIGSLLEDPPVLEFHDVG